MYNLDGKPNNRSYTFEWITIPSPEDVCRILEEAAATVVTVYRSYCGAEMLDFSGRFGDFELSVATERGSRYVDVILAPIFM